MNRYDRVMIKLSGGAFAGVHDWGFDKSSIDNLAAEIISLAGAGIQVGVMVGGGNIFRGRIADQWGIERVEADHIGMTATVLNSLMLRAALNAMRPDLEVRVMSAVPMAAFAEPYIRLRAIKHLDKGYAVIFAGGTGQPLVTTDYPAVQRAIEINADALLAAKQGTSGVYTDDPNLHPNAKLYTNISDLPPFFGPPIMSVRSSSDLLSPSSLSSSSLPLPGIRPGLRRVSGSRGCRTGSGRGSGAG